ncbi:hypothetical protein [Nocardioides pacificus]
MDPISLAMTRLYVTLSLLPLKPPERDERGDVPGWVMITVMTAGLVGGLLAIARPQLNQMLRNALAGVTG